MRFGRFEVQRVLGRGGMGTVYLAEDPLIGRTVAIKEIRVDPTDDERERKELEARFKLEFRAAGKLSHPNIVTIYDVGQGGNSYFIAMEYVAGMSLAELLRDKPSLEPGELADLAGQIASGLDYAHDRDIVHRDIKPANVLMTRDRRPKITDFGLVKMLTSELTMTGTVLGTPAFMSPEQVMGDDVTGKSDQFSFAIILYLMLTGDQPFAADHPSAILYKIVHEAPVPPHTVNGALPAAIDRVVLRGLSKLPADRYPTCSDLAADFAAALGEAQPIGLSEVSTQPEHNPTQPDPVHEDELSDSKTIGADTTQLTPASFRLDAGPTPTPRRSVRQKDSGPLKLLGAVAFIIAMAILGYVASSHQKSDQPGKSPAFSEEILIQQRLQVEAGPPGASILVNGENSEWTVPANILLNGRSGEIFHLEVSVDGEIAASRDIVLSSEPLEPWLLSSPVATTIDVTSQPAGAAVFVAGSDTGITTPAKLDFAANQDHTLVLRLEGYEPTSWTFRIDELSQEQQQCRCIHFPLRSSKPPGFVTINAPYAVKLLAGGKSHGPFAAGIATEVALPPGRHKVTLVAEDVFLSQTSLVEVESGQQVSMRPPPAIAIRITANPANCRVSIDGKDVDDTPINNLLIVAGPHDFSFYWPALGQTKHFKKTISRSLKSISASPD